MTNNSKNPILRFPTRNENDADHLAIIAVIVGAYIIYSLLFSTSTEQVFKPFSILVCTLMVISGPLIWIRIPYAKWGCVIAFCCILISGAILAFQHGLSLSRIFVICGSIYGIISYMRIDYQIDRGRPEPNAATVDFVGFYIDKVHELNWPDNGNEYIAFFNNLPHPQRTLWATWILQLEIDNGGHSQYFYNLHDDSYLDRCVDGLDELNAKKILKILKDALKLIEVCKDELTSSNNWQEWIKVLDKYKLREKLWRLDEDFFRQKADYYELQKVYIEKHIESFEKLGKYITGSRRIKSNRKGKG